MFCGIKNNTTRVRMLSFGYFYGIDSPAIALSHVYCPTDDMLFEVGAEIRCSDV